VAYTFAPPILVTPLGALSVLVGAVLASFLLHERLGKLGIIGCALCLTGTVVIVVNAPEDREIQTVDEILAFAMRAPFLTYCAFVAIFSTYMVLRIVPRYGRTTPVVYLSVCSLVGSISVMSVKAFGVALRLTLNGSNQFTHISTYAFGLMVALCIMIQMNYFNRALDQFSTNVVNPIYYVMFTTSTITASVLLFQGFDTSAPAAVSLIGGFIVTFVGVYLLNIKGDYAPDQHHGAYEALPRSLELRGGPPSHGHEAPAPFVLDEADAAHDAYPLDAYPERPAP